MILYNLFDDIINTVVDHTDKLHDGMIVLLACLPPHKDLTVKTSLSSASAVPHPLICFLCLFHVNQQHVLPKPLSYFWTLLSRLADNNKALLNVFKLTLGDVLGSVRGRSADGCLLLHYGGILLLYLKKIIVIVGLLVIGFDFQAGQKGGEKGKEGEKKTARGDSCEAPVSASDVCNVVRCASDVERFHLYIHLHVCVVKVVVVYTAIYLTCVSFECLYVGGFSLNHPPITTTITTTTSALRLLPS